MNWWNAARDAIKARRASAFRESLHEAGHARSVFEDRRKYDIEHSPKVQAEIRAYIEDRISSGRQDRSGRDRDQELER